MLQDIRFAVRSLIKHRGVTLVAMLCIALGIGVNAMVFSTVDGVLLQPFPFKDPERIVVVRGANKAAGIRRSNVSYRDLQDLSQQAVAFDAVAGVAFRSLAVGDGAGEPERIAGGLITSNLFSLLGVRPALGRDFLPAEDRPNVERVVIISDDLWLRRYHRDPAVLGRTILVNATPHVIVGVMPERFKFPEVQEAWVPIDPVLHDAARNVRDVRVFARLKDGVSLDRAAEDVRGVAARLAQTYATDNAGWSMFTRILREDFIPQQVRLILLTMMGAVSLVLLIACANVANLLLARATARHREIAVRTAIGAGRWHIVRQLLAESLTIALVSVPLGIAFAKIGLQWLDRAVPRSDSLPYYVHWSLDGRSLVYLIAISVATGLLFGLAPAMQALKPQLVDALKEGARGSGVGLKRNRLRNLLVVAEVAMSLVLLIGAALFTRSFLSLENAPDGFDTAPLMTMRFYLPGDTYQPEGLRLQRVQDIVRRVESIPGVEAATISNLIPRAGGGTATFVQIEGRPFERDRASMVFYAGVTPHFLRTLNVALLGGRDFTQLEGDSRSGVAVIGESMAKKYWPGADPLGRRFALEGETRGQMDWFTVIGIVRDIGIQAVDSDETFDLAFVPYPYMSAFNNGLTVRVTSGDPARITAPVRAQIRAADANVPIYNIVTMAEGRRLGFWLWGLFGKMFAAFGVIALVLAAIGVYGVLSYSVTQRTHEIGVRVALGAARRQVLSLVVLNGMKLAGAGIVIGLAGALAVTQLIRSVLFVSPTDPLSFGGISLFLVVVALVASYVPARRATAVDPIVALRDQ